MTLVVTRYRPCGLQRAVHHLWHHLLTLIKTRLLRDKYQSSITSMAAKQVKRKRQHAVADSSLFSRFTSLWTLRSTFLCWKSCSVASRMEHDALHEMHAVEELSRSLVVAAQRSGAGFLSMLSAVHLWQCAHEQNNLSPIPPPGSRSLSSCRIKAALAVCMARLEAACAWQYDGATARDEERV